MFITGLIGFTWSPGFSPPRQHGRNYHTISDHRCKKILIELSFGNRIFVDQKGKEKNKPTAIYWLVEWYLSIWWVILIALWAHGREWIKSNCVKMWGKKELIENVMWTVRFLCELFLLMPPHHLMWLCNLIKYKNVFIMLSFSIIQYMTFPLWLKHSHFYNESRFCFYFIGLDNNIFHHSLLIAHTHIHISLMTIKIWSITYHKKKVSSINKEQKLHLLDLKKEKNDIS